MATMTETSKPKEAGPITAIVGYKGDPSCLRPPSERFTCGERIVTEKDEINDDSGYGASRVAFECHIKEGNSGTSSGSSVASSKLRFYCREPSCGVLTEEEPAAVKEDDGAVDPSFFDPGYTLAGKTGFQVWPGSRLVVESLVVPQESDSAALRAWQALVQNEIRVVELGAGVGVVGASLAQAGAQVLLTDLPTLVVESLQPNLLYNSKRSSNSNTAKPTWLSTNSSSVLSIGKGWVSAAALDWSVPVNQQLTTEQCQVDLIIASDCVWLVTMLEGLLTSVQSIFEASTRNPKLLMSFQRRDAKGSDMFTTVDGVLTELKINRKWNVQCLAWHPVVYEADGVKDKSQEVFLFQVDPK